MASQEPEENKRSKTGGRRYTKILVLLVSEDMDREIRERAFGSGRTLSVLARELIERGLVTERKIMQKEREATEITRLKRAKTRAANKKAAQSGDVAKKATKKTTKKKSAAKGPGKKSTG